MSRSILSTLKSEKNCIIRYCKIKDIVPSLTTTSIDYDSQEKNTIFNNLFLNLKIIIYSVIIKHRGDVRPPHLNMDGK